jgi:uncharacterized membrane protein YcaP (DUF421 family)
MLLPRISGGHHISVMTSLMVIVGILLGSILLSALIKQQEEDAET